MNSTKRTVLITGAARGIGAACAEKFASLGYNLVLNYRTSEEQALTLAQTLKQNGAEILCGCADVSDKSAVESLFAQAEAAFGQVDILINNAGISQIKMLCDVTEDDWRHMFAVNMDSAYLCSKRALSAMVSKKWGRIINISSINAAASSGETLRFMGVSIKPGASALTVIPEGASSLASALVKPISAALEAE